LRRRHVRHGRCALARDPDGGPGRLVAAAERRRAVLRDADALPRVRARRRRRLPHRRPLVVAVDAARAPPSRCGDAVMIELDPGTHAQARLRITSALATLGRDGKISFPRLQELLGMTAGNLSTHLRRLEDAGYVTVEKTHERRTPVTYVALSKT